MARWKLDGRSFAGAVLVVLAFQEPPAAQSLRPVSKTPVNVSADLPSVSLVPITGTSRMFQPSAGVANLDAGDLVAGRTWWEVEGVVFVETYVGFLWSPSTGSSVFAIPVSQYFNDNIQFVAEISDQATVVGTDVFTNTFRNFPFRWTEESGFQFLPTPGGQWNGSATAVSSNGAIVAGAVQQGLFNPLQAARWIQGALDVVGPPGSWSIAYDLSGDGAVMVGEIGPDSATLEAERWIQGDPQGLAAVPGETFSTARFSSDDGSIAIGWATVGSRNVLARWDGTGAVTGFFPSGALSVETIHAINPAGTAAVGALIENDDQAPFLWRLADGFTILGELDREQDYDRSEALDVSDNGMRVVGRLGASVVFNGDPPPIGFLWMRGETHDIEQLLITAGEPPRGIFDAFAISGDGNRIVATGTVRPTIHDTSSVLIEFENGIRVK